MDWAQTCCLLDLVFHSAEITGVFRHMGLSPLIVRHMLMFQQWYYIKRLVSFFIRWLGDYPILTFSWESSTYLMILLFCLEVYRLIARWWPRKCPVFCIICTYFFLTQLIQLPLTLWISFCVSRTILLGISSYVLLGGECGLQFSSFLTHSLHFDIYVVLFDSLHLILSSHLVISSTAWFWGRDFSLPLFTHNQNKIG